TASSSASPRPSSPPPPSRRWRSRSSWSPTGCSTAPPTSREDAAMARKPERQREGRLLDIRNLKIEATVYPPGEDPRSVTIVHGVSLTLERGKVLGLIGESGAGKSTIGLSAMGYGRGGVRITGGEVLLNG